VLTGEHGVGVEKRDLMGEMFTEIDLNQQQRLKCAFDQEGLLKYLISFRNHNEFHEQCVERIFTDVMRMCKPVKLAVYARYTRRGGLDINPFRTNYNTPWPDNRRNARQ